MKKIETSLNTLLDDIKKFYVASKWHFITVNAVDERDGIELQYLFSQYGCVEDVVCFYLKVSYEDEIPSITSLIPSAYLGQMEIVDMFGINVKDTPSGIFLEEDSPYAPLRKES